MKNTDKNEPLPSGKRQVRKLPKVLVPSTFKTPPKGLPIDFYHPKWFCGLLEAQKKSIPNTQAVAFLPDASESLRPKNQRHEHEKLSDSSFTRKYWDILAEPYGLLEADSSDSGSENDEVRANQQSDSEGEGHDLDDPSPDVSEDEYLDEGEAGQLYDEDFVVDDGEGEDSDEDGDYEDDNDDSDNGTNKDDNNNIQHGSNFNDDVDVDMAPTKYGVNQSLLSMMEEEEDGW